MKRILRRALLTALALVLAVGAVMPAGALVYGSIDRYAEHSLKLREDSSAFITKGNRVLLVIAEDVNGKLRQLKAKDWTSSDPTVASVHAQGWVKARHSGTTRITLTAADGTTRTLKLTVIKSNTPTRIYFKQDAVSAYTGARVELAKYLRAKPVSGLLALNTVTWKSSDRRVATVNKLGVLTGRKPGKVRITATCGTLKATITVTVRKNQMEWV